MYLKHRDKIVAHNLAYGNNPNYDSVESSANRLLRIPEIADTIQSIQDTIRHEVEEEFKAKYREELLSIYDKRMLLKRIATGEMYVEQKYKGKNCTQCSQYISPTINQMLAAIREDNKLAGHHPFKQNGKWVIPALQTQQEENITPENDNKRQQVSLSPAGGGVSLSADGGGAFAQENPQQETTTDNTSPIGVGGNLPQNTPEIDNNRQQPHENETDNQSLVEQPETHDTAAVNSSGRIISQEKLRELLYPQKPKLSYMKNNP